MKLTNVVSICAFSAGLFLVQEPLLAQASPSGATVIAANPQSAAVVPPKKIASLKIKPGGLMSDAVAALLDSMKVAQLPEINVLYGPGAEQVAVPELNLRNVTGPDALRLVAVSANCEAEPISGDGGITIGYMIREKVEAALGDLPAANLFGGSFGVPNPANARYTASVPFSADVPATQRTPTAANSAPVRRSVPSKTLFGRTGIVSSDAAPAGDSAAVRVYPLGVATNNVKFNEIEGTLREVLKADGIAADATKFALHEKTNVLVVTGTHRVQDLVMQVLDALRKNQTDTDLRQTAQHDVTELKIRLDAEQRQKSKLDEQLAKTEAQLRELDQELARLKASAAKPPQ